MKCRGVETSGSTARSDVREDFAQAKPQGNPSPTTILKNNASRKGIVIRIQKRADFINGDIAVNVAFGSFQKIGRRGQTIDLLKSDSRLPSLSFIPFPGLALQQILIKVLVVHKMLFSLPELYSYWYII